MAGPRPLADDPPSRQGTDRRSGRLRILPVEGESLHQVAVGPVHAGIIEPGHFRFTVQGETVVRLEERLGYTHKGTDSLMAGATTEQGAKLAARTSGDSTVAYGWAYAQAVEAAVGTKSGTSHLAARAHGRDGTAGQPSGRHRCDLQRRSLWHDVGPMFGLRERVLRVSTMFRPPYDARYRRARRNKPRS